MMQHNHKIISTILPHYALGEKKLRVRPLAPNTQKTLLLIDGDETFHLSYTAKTSYTPQNLLLLQRLCSNLPIKPIASVDGKFNLFELDGVAVLQFMGKNCYNGDINAEIAKSAGSALAKLHLTTTDGLSIAPAIFTIETISSKVDAMQATISSEDQNIYQAIKEELDFLKSALKPRKIATSATFGIFTPQLATFSENYELLGITAPLNCSEDYAVYDLAMALLKWSFDDQGIINEMIFKNFLTGYQSVRPLDKHEKRYFYLAMRWAALKTCVLTLDDEINETEEKTANNNLIKLKTTQGFYTFHDYSF